TTRRPGGSPRPPGRPARAVPRPLRFRSGEPPHYDPSMYHYVIVGGGSAGCVLANRLSENPFTRVLLLEAGGRGRRREIAVPAAFSRLFGTTVDWGYRTEPQRELAGRRLYWPRGKVLGGSSAINAMIYVRGNPLDYDAWRSAGNAGWSWADVLPYF